MTITCELTVYRIPNIHYVCVGVVGNLEELGCWDTKRVIRSSTTSGDLHHITLNLPEQTRLEYKWLLRDGDTWRWEPGPNKVVDLPKYGSCFIMNQWAGPAVVDTQVPGSSPIKRRSDRIDTEWKVGTPGTVYKNPDHIPTGTPRGAVTVFTGTKIPFGENYIQDPPPAPVIESEKTREKANNSINRATRQTKDTLRNYLTPANDVTTGSCACAGTSGGVCTTPGSVGGQHRANNNERCSEVLTHVRTFVDTCCHWISHTTSELSTEKKCAGIAVSCLLFYTAYKACKQ